MEENSNIHCRASEHPLGIQTIPKLKCPKLVLNTFFRIFKQAFHLHDFTSILVLKFCFGKFTKAELSAIKF